jgi:hypothetical protein
VESNRNMRLHKTSNLVSPKPGPEGTAKVGAPTASTPLLKPEAALLQSNKAVTQLATTSTSQPLLFQRAAEEVFSYMEAFQFSRWVLAVTPIDCC